MRHRLEFARGAKVAPVQTAGKCVTKHGMGFLDSDWFCPWSTFLVLPVPVRHPGRDPAWLDHCDGVTGYSKV